MLLLNFRLFCFSGASLLKNNMKHVCWRNSKMNVTSSTRFRQGVDEVISNILWVMRIDFQWNKAWNSGWCNWSEIVMQNIWVPILFGGISTTRTGSHCAKRPTYPISMSSKLLQMYRWFGRNQLLSGSGPIQVVSVFSYSEDGLWFSPVLDAKKAKITTTRFIQKQ